MSVNARNFWSKVEKSDGCWEWRGYCAKRTVRRLPYGAFGVDGKVTTAHRASWMLHYGDIPKGMQVCHHCDNPKCVRPEHLFLGTCKDNIRDMIAKGRRPKFQGEDHGHSKLTAVQVDEIRLLYALRVGSDELARMYGLHRAHVQGIIAGRAWKNVPLMPKAG